MKKMAKGTKTPGLKVITDNSNFPFGRKGVKHGAKHQTKGRGVK